MPPWTYGTVTGCEARAYQSRQDTLSSRGRPDCQGSPACSGRCLQACEVGRNSGLSYGPTRGMLAVMQERFWKSSGRVSNATTNPLLKLRTNLKTSNSCTAASSGRGGRSKVIQGYVPRRRRHEGARLVSFGYCHWGRSGAKLGQLVPGGNA